MNRSITICADDYAQNEAISSGILQLLKHKRINAVSCMVTSRLWPEHAQRLKAFIGKAAIGLHFNLSYPAHSKMSLLSLLIRSHLRLLSRKAIHDALQQQITLFLKQLNRMPDFIDGHQHIQNFPVIRDELISFYQKKLTQQKQAPYIRCSWQKIHNNHQDYLSRLKAQCIAYSGARHFKHMLESLEIPHNTSFAGIYHFDSKKPYHKIFEQFISSLSKGGLLMCHPAQFNGWTSSALQAGDMLEIVRQREFDYLISEKMESVLRKHGLMIL